MSTPALYVTRPILFSAPMIRALLEGTKTQTRRLIDAHNSLVNGAGVNTARWRSFGFDFSRAWKDDGPSPAGNPGPYLHVPSDGELAHRVYPRYQPGDMPWVRETWFPTRFDFNDLQDRAHIRYAADGIYDPRRDCVGRSWKPSIHMPRWASRLTLRITDVRVERLNEISSDDAAAEGWPGPDENNTISSAYPIAWYAQLWEQINGRGSWDANPWVWVIAFEVIRANVDDVAYVVAA